MASVVITLCKFTIKLAFLCKTTWHPLPIELSHLFPYRQSLELFSCGIILGCMDVLFSHLYCEICISYHMFVSVSGPVSFPGVTVSDRVCRTRDDTSRFWYIKDLAGDSAIK